MSARVVIALSAEAQIDRHQAWWREHRAGSPWLFAESFALALGQLESAPECGTPYTDPRVANVRRLPIAQTGHALYYVHDSPRVGGAAPSSGVVTILAITGPGRGRPPRLARR